MHAACQDLASRTVTSRGDYKPEPTGYRARIRNGPGWWVPWNGVLPRESRRNEQTNRQDVNRELRVLGELRPIDPENVYTSCIKATTSGYAGQSRAVNLLVIPENS